MARNAPGPKMRTAAIGYTEIHGYANYGYIQPLDTLLTRQIQESSHTRVGPVTAAMLCEGVAVCRYP